jgi:hypothetical protein
VVVCRNESGRYHSFLTFSTYFYLFTFPDFPFILIILNKVIFFGRISWQKVLKLRCPYEVSQKIHSSQFISINKQFFLHQEVFVSIFLTFSLLQLLLILKQWNDMWLRFIDIILLNKNRKLYFISSAALMLKEYAISSGSSIRLLHSHNNKVEKINIWKLDYK